jgi:hypothetical protein
MEPRSPTIERAEQAMKARRFDEAIAAFEAHLAESPDDVRALLRLGLCHLLDRSEETFVAIHGRARALIEGLREMPADLARLWAHYQQLLRKVSATALVVGTMALPACQSQTRAPAKSLPPASPDASAVATTPAKPAPPAAADAGIGATWHQTVQPGHRYSGGVRPNTIRPGHRYSAGVRPGKPEDEDWHVH